MRSILKVYGYYIALTLVLFISSGAFYTIGAAKHPHISECPMAFKEQHMGKIGWEGFHPVYVYVYSKPLTKPVIPSGPRA